MNVIDKDLRCDRSTLNDWEESTQYGVAIDNTSDLGMDEYMEDWFCSLELAHSGPHIAYMEHDLDQDAVYVWSIGSMPIMEIL